MFRKFYLDDPFNKQNNRSVKTTPRNTYNCGGYALGLFSWYCPHNPEDEAYLRDYDCMGYDYGFRNREEAWIKTMYAVSKMVLDFEGNLRMITDLAQLQKSERVVAFRLSSDGDFHYVKKCYNGKWQHKRGSSYPIYTMTQNEVFNTDWCGRYDGPIVLLAIKK